MVLASSERVGGAEERGVELRKFLVAEVGHVEENEPDQLVAALMALAQASIELAEKIAHAPLAGLTGVSADESSNSSGEVQKKLDVVANELFKNALVSCGGIAAVASEEERAVVEAAGEGAFVAVFDPLDGSRNIDASIPTGTIFGIYRRDPALSMEDCALQSGDELVASGYTLYSSATQLTIALRGRGCHVFTFDRTRRAYVLSQRALSIPPRGQIYSLNDARYFDWPQGLRDYIDNIRQARGQNGVQYSARYVCSLVADFHRTLLYGGWAGNPRSHLRLVYEANPLAMVVEEAGGAASDGRRRVRGIQPSALHQRLPLFLGSVDDLAELESYDVQQTGEQVYTV